MLWEIIFFVLGFLGGHIVSQWLSFKYSIFLWANRAIILFIGYKIRQFKKNYIKLIHFIKKKTFGEKEHPVSSHSQHQHHQHQHHSKKNFNLESLFQMLFDGLNTAQSPLNILPTHYTTSTDLNDHHQQDNLQSCSLDILESGDQNNRKRKPLQKPSSHLLHEE